MKHLFKLAFSLFFVISTFNSVAQNQPFDLILKPINVQNLGGLQSFAFGQHNGKWLIVGGRLDGLHRRQPWAAFDVAGHNTELIVVDPVSLQKWTAPLSTLAVGIQEQLRSTNMQFYQEGDYLYCTGGYGYSATITDHTTYDKLTAIKVSDVINAVVNGTSYSSFFRQISDTNFQVTGGHLEKIDSTFYLIGGHKFLGRYNPMGPTHGPGFTQEYTNAIRKFTLVDNGTSISINHLAAIIDSANLHRRDYNAEPQIFPNGTQGITAFSGVFQPVVDLPYLNSVDIDSSGYTVNNTFQQYYNHYHCAVLPVYSQSKKEMHTVFFGGIAQFYDSANFRIQDNNVPFVKTIARVSRDSSGVMTENKLGIEMPSLLGAGSEFLPIETLPKYANGVLKMDDFLNDTTTVGYIYGGISSTAANIFFTNNGTQSSASSQIFEVSLVKRNAVGLNENNKSEDNTFDLQIFPNPANEGLKIEFNLISNSDVTFTFVDSHGNLVDSFRLENLIAGKNSINRKIGENFKNGVYFLTIKTDYSKTSKKLIIKK